MTFHTRIPLNLISGFCWKHIPQKTIYEHAELSLGPKATTGRLFATLRKAIISLVTSLRPYDTTRLPQWADLHEI